MDYLTYLKEEIQPEIAECVQNYLLTRPFHPDHAPGFPHEDDHAVITKIWGAQNMSELVEDVIKAIEDNVIDEVRPGTCGDYLRKYVEMVRNENPIFARVAESDKESAQIMMCIALENDEGYQNALFDCETAIQRDLQFLIVRELAEYTHLG